MSRSRVGDGRRKARSVVDVKKVLRENPQIDGRELAQALKTVRELRKRGIGGSGYNLMIPFTRRARVPSDFDEQGLAPIFAHRPD